MLFSKSSLALALATSISLLSSSNLAVEAGVQRKVPRRRLKDTKASKYDPTPSPTPIPDPQTRSVSNTITAGDLIDNDWRVLAPVDHQVSVFQQDFGGTVFIINGDVYRFDDRDPVDLTEADIVGFYNQKCTVAKGTMEPGPNMGTTLSIIQNICEYNFCITEGDGKESCVFLRSGGSFPFTPMNEEAVVPPIHAAALGGTGQFQQFVGPVDILVESRAGNNTLADATSIFNIQFGGMLFNSMFT